MDDPVVFLDHPMSSATLCIFSREDARLMTRWMNDFDTRQHLMRFAPLMLEGEEKWLADMAQNSSVTHALTEALFLVVAKDKNKRVGTMGLHKIDWKNRFATTGTAIGDKEYRGKGLASDAKMLLLSWAFNECGLNKVDSRVIANNEPSLAYCRNAAMPK